jgi:hypothetical protein
MHHQISPQSLLSTYIGDSNDPTTQPSGGMKMPQWLTSALPLPLIQTSVHAPAPEFPTDPPHTGLIPPSASPPPEFSFSPGSIPMHSNHCILPNVHQTRPASCLPYSREQPNPPLPRQLIRSTPRGLNAHSPNSRRDAYKFQDSDPDSTWSTFPVRKKAQKANIVCAPSILYMFYDSSGSSFLYIPVRLRLKLASRRLDHLCCRSS